MPAEKSPAARAHEEAWSEYESLVASEVDQQVRCDEEPGEHPLCREATRLKLFARGVLESRLREEERAKAELAIQIQREAAKGAIAAAKVRVLEEVLSRYAAYGTDQSKTIFMVIDQMKKEARAEGASEHSWMACPDPAYSAPNPIYGSHAETQEHHRKHHEKEPEPGGGRCRICGINDPRIVHVDDASHPVVCYVKERGE